MVKSYIWIGIVVLAIGVVVGLWFVVPHIGQTGAPGLNGVTQNTLSPLAVLVAAAGLAGGSILLGVGVGRWRHPRPAPRGQHGAEI
jgi:hypothetical protein